jgi:iron(III) transport system substrate-binding protein
MQSLASKSIRRSLAVATIASAAAITMAATVFAQELVVGDTTIADAELWAAAQKEGSFILYTSQSPTASEAMNAAFTEDTGINIETVPATAARIYERILSEAGAGVLNADLIWITDAVLIDGIAANGILAEFEPVGYDKLADEFKAPNNGPYFIPLQAVNALSYNTELVAAADVPKKWSDLLDPKWADKKLGWTVVTGGSNWARELWLRETYGREYWEGIARQKPIISDSNAVTTELLSRGEVMVAVGLPASVAKAAEDGAPVEVIFPEDGMIAYNQYLALAGTAKNPNAAKVFLNWILSPKGQEAVAVKLGNYPVMEGAPGPVVGNRTLPKRGEALIVQPNAENLLKLRDQYQDEWMKMMGITG